MLFGLVAAFLLVLRIAMGFFGSRHSRFANFPVSPGAIIRYFTGIVTGQAKRFAGHNPGSALVTLVMLALIRVVVLAGALDGGERFEDMHEVVAYVLLGMIGVHLLGIVLHTLRHRENIAFAMIDGKKIAAPEDAVGSSHSIWAAVLGIATAAWVVALFSNHDTRAAKVRLPVLGTVIQLGGNETGHDHSRVRWCPERGSNPHALRRRILSPLRLPIPPSGLRSVRET
ncbi:MAG: hypothetical protein RIQ93_1123 [Verrucomicrobiota bacterium]